jgi:signal recognition particle receptor subunit beta
MARFDKSTGEIVLRVVYDGPATAGKSTNVRGLQAAYAAQSRGELFVPEHTAGGRTRWFDWLLLDAGHLDDRALRVEVLTVPGQLAFASLRFRLLHGADAVVFVCESTAARLLAARVAWGFLSRTLAVIGASDLPIVLQANKQDLDGALAPTAVAREIGCTPTASLGARALDGDGVRMTFHRAFDLARVRLRAEGLPERAESLPPSETPEQLYAALRELEGAAMSHELESALERALAEVQES